MGRNLTKPRDPTMRYIAKLGLFDAVALQCRVSPATVRAWTRVPAARVDDVQIAIGRRRSLIRPDLYSRSSPNP